MVSPTLKNKSTLFNCASKKLQLGRFWIQTCQKNTKTPCYSAIRLEKLVDLCFTPKTSVHIESFSNLFPAYLWVQSYSTSKHHSFCASMVLNLPIMGVQRGHCFWLLATLTKSHQADPQRQNPKPTTNPQPKERPPGHLPPRKRKTETNTHTHL